VNSVTSKIDSDYSNFLPLLLQTQSILACNAVSLAFIFGTHHFFGEEDDSGDSEGVNAVGLDVDLTPAITLHTTLH